MKIFRRGRKKHQNFRTIWEFSCMILKLVRVKNIKKVEKMSKVTQIFRKRRKVKVAGHGFRAPKSKRRSRKSPSKKSCDWLCKGSHQKENWRSNTSFFEPRRENFLRDGPPLFYRRRRKFVICNYEGIFRTFYAIYGRFNTSTDQMCTVCSIFLSLTLTCRLCQIEVFDPLLFV